MWGGYGDAMSIAPRLMIKFPSGSTWASTNDWDGHLDLVASREFEETIELVRQRFGADFDPAIAARWK